ncbi:thiamine-phosphate kinase, partial [Amycolatopsis sp. H6(2020)]|nr:thiamine-phosphate kinase [Amycolatopsis sp. H6(2020)]
MTPAHHAAQQGREPAPGTAAATGEEGILRRILPIFAAQPAGRSPEGPRVVEGPGDDAAVYDLAGRLAVLSTDTQTQGEDHLLRWPCGHRTRGAELGWKSAAQNLADLAAMGADPLSLVISLSFPGTTAVDFLEDMA